jgi:hypothetical protein
LSKDLKGGNKGNIRPECHKTKKKQRKDWLKSKRLIRFGKIDRNLKDG